MMMVEATKDDWYERIDIEKCLIYLRKQLEIGYNEVSEEELNKYKCHENLLFYDATVLPNYKAYNEQIKIDALLQSLIPGIEIRFNDGLRHWSIKPIKYSYLLEDIIEFCEEWGDGQLKRTLVRAVVAEKHDDKIILKTETIDEAISKKYKQEREVCICGKAEVIIPIDFGFDEHAKKHFR